MKNLETPKNVPEAGPNILVRTTLCFLPCILSTCPRQVSIQPPYCVLVPENRGSFQKKLRPSFYTSGAGRNREARHLNAWQGAGSGPPPLPPVCGEGYTPTESLACPEPGWILECFCEPEDLSFYWIWLLISCAIQGTSPSFSGPHFPSVIKEFGLNYL